MKTIQSTVRVLSSKYLRQVYILGNKAKRARQLSATMLVFIVVLASVFIYSTPEASAATWGPNPAGTAAGSSWTGVTSSQVCDNVYATQLVAASGTGGTDTLTNYGFSIPTGSTISGIQVDFHKFATSATKNTMEDSQVQLYVGGVATGSNLATATKWPTSIGDTVYGGSSNLWGLTPTVAQVDSSNFGVVVAPKNVKSGSGSTALTASIDCVELTITYTPPPNTYTESNYRFFNNANSYAPGSALTASDNTAITSLGDGVPFRLREEIAVGGASDPAGGQSFELQYAVQSGGSCGATPSANFANVTDTTVVGYYNNASLVNNSNITASLNDPNDGNVTVDETYEGAGVTTFSNNTAIPTGEDGIWDFALVTNDAPASTTYCLRIVTSVGGVLNAYNQMPQFTTPTATVNQSSFRYYKNQDGTASGWIEPNSAAPFTGSTGAYGGESLYFNNKLWYMGGVTSGTYSNSVWCSADGGVTWSDTTCGTTAAGWGARAQFGATVFNNEMWVMGGFNGSNGTRYHDVWCSSDGTTWSDTTCGTTAAGWTVRESFVALTYNNKIWIMGGSGATSDTNDVWCSSDGTTWSDTTCGTTAAGWPARDAFAGYVFNNEMWVVEGENAHTSSYYNDVWCSTDGATWSDSTCGSFSLSNVTAREGAQGVVYNGLMWIMGGYNGTDLNDVYCSSDGATWVAAGTAPCGTAPTWSARDSGSSVATPSAMYVIAGENLSGDFKDVWSYSAGGADVSTPIANQNSAVDLFGTGTSPPAPVVAAPTNQPFRMRWIVSVGGSAEAKNTLSMNLQYAEVSGGSCSATPSANYANVTTTTPVQFYTGNTVAVNGGTLMQDGNDPTDGSAKINYQDYVTTNPFTNNQSDIPGNQDGLWDFALKMVSSPPHTSYCLRVVLSGSGTPLGTNNYYPAVDVAPTPVQILRGREWWNSSGVRQFKDIK